MPQALKASWTVRAGVIPGTPDPKFTKVWTYTSEDSEKDAEICDLHDIAIFSQKRAAAADYYQQVSNPKRMNWATLEFLWL